MKNGIRFVTREEFLDLHKSQKGITPDIGLRIPYIADEIKVMPEAGSRVVRFAVSTEGVDRDKDIIKADGWNLTNYQKNPVVLWAHSYNSLPIARAITIGVESPKLVSAADFYDEKVNPLSESVFQMIKLGGLRAASVGFRPLKHAYDEERRGFDITEAELLEWSVVPVPANPEALVQYSAAAKGTPALKAYVAWCEQYLDEHYGGKGIWVLREQVEEVFKTMNAKKVAVLTDLNAKDPVLSSLGDPTQLSIPKPTTIAEITGNEEELPELFILDMEEVAKDEFELEIEEEDEESFEIDADLVTAGIGKTIKETLSEIITNAVRSEVNHARGRID